MSCESFLLFLGEARGLLTAAGRYHRLNHWVLFGGGYRGGALRIMKELIAEYGGGGDVQGGCT